MHFFRRRPVRTSSFLPPPPPPLRFALPLAHACQIQHLKFHRVLLPTVGRGGRQDVGFPWRPSLLPSFPSLARPYSPLLSSPRPPVCMLGWLCVRCARTSKISICSLIQSRSSGGGGRGRRRHLCPLQPVLFLPSSRPVPLSLSFLRCRRLTSISGRGRDSSLFFFAGGGRAISVCTQPRQPQPPSSV